MIKSYILALILVACLFNFLPSLNSQTLKLSDKKFDPGENITLTFRAKASYPSNAWVGIVPSEIRHGEEALNDKHDIAYQYMKNQKKGKMQFVAPKLEGYYDFRMHDGDASRSKEVASISFIVGKPNKKEKDIK